MKKVKVKLKDGTTVIGDEFDMGDYKKFQQIFRKWMNINIDLKQFGGRNLNVPDVFSEALYCIFFNAVRTNGTAHSYDAVDKITGEGIQIKSASIKKDCTSFGPTSTWDKLIFVDLAPFGEVDGNIWFYEIDSSNIYNIVLNYNKSEECAKKIKEELNSKKNETFRDQQLQGRRPRFSIKDKIINPLRLTPIKKINLMEDNDE